jgi:hypothetical protein
VCPVTDTVIYEAFHQGDFNTRLMTARVIDELSAGMALQETSQRVGIEILHCLRSSRLSADALYPLSNWV